MRVLTDAGHSRPILSRLHSPAHAGWAQQGDKLAFSVLYERYTFPVLSYLCRMLGNRDDAESLGQDVFVRVLRFAVTYRYPSKFSTWLFTIARNLAINSSRRRLRNPV